MSRWELPHVKPLKLDMRVSLLALMIGLFASMLQAESPTGRIVQDRVNADIEAREPVVAHVVVALCDNLNQGIVPVPKSLGDGQQPSEIREAAAAAYHRYQQCGTNAALRLFSSEP